MAILNIDEIDSGSEGETQWAHLSVVGEIDLDTISKLRTKLTEVEERGVACLILDFKETSYVNSSALAALVKFAERFRVKGGGIHLVAVNRRVKLVFEMLGLLSFFKFFDSTDEAKSTFSGA